MKISSKLTIVSSVLFIAGCAHRERQAESNESYPSSSYAAGTTSQFQGSSQFRGRTGSDQTLVTQVQDALTRDTTLAAIAPRIEVTAQNGTVTLSGSVPSDQDKQRIEAMVKSTTGVVSVNNQLQVSLQPTAERSGQSSRLYQEPTGQAPYGQANISTEPAKTDTSTTESSKSQLFSTDQSTTQPGTSDLAPTSQPGTPSRIYFTNQTSSTDTSGQTADTLSLNIQGNTEMDRTLGQRVMQELRTDASLAGQISAIKLAVDNGKITLRGTVKSEDQKKSIETAVQRVTGVASIDNEIQVSATPVSTSDTDQNK